MQKAEIVVFPAIFDECRIFEVLEHDFVFSALDTVSMRFHTEQVLEIVIVVDIEY